MTKIQSIRQEYGEPFREVVKGFALQGNSKRLTARSLNISDWYFKNLCDRFDLHRHFKPQQEQRKECRPGGKGWPKGKPRKV